jgi:hypothetical protein
MKKILLVLLTITCTFQLQAQEIRPQADSLITLKEHYLQRSRVNKTTGNILLLGGLGVALVGLLSGSGNSGDGLDMDFTGPFMFLGGLGAALISIPFYISSSQNAFRAATISAGASSLPLSPGLNTRAVNWQPSVNLKIPIR